MKKKYHRKSMDCFVKANTYNTHRRHYQIYTTESLRIVNWSHPKQEKIKLMRSFTKIYDHFHLSLYFKTATRRCLKRHRTEKRSALKQA